MASQTRQPGTLASSTTYHASDFNFPIRKSWVNPGNAAANDGSLTTSTFIVQAGSSGAGTEMLLATNFGFTIPDGARIDGVQVTYEMSRSGGTLGTFEYVGRMVLGGTIKNTNKADIATPGTFTGNKVYGGPTDLWGETLTSALINATDFGMVTGAQVVSIGPNTDSGLANVDVIDLTVYYTVIPPPITISAFTDVSSTRGTGNAEITSTGGATPDKRGFVFGINPLPDPGNVAPSSSGYAQSTEETGTFAAGTFSLEVNQMPAGSLIFARAYAHNSAGYSYSSEINFLTLDATTSQFNDDDPTEIVRQIVDYYQSVGGSVVYDGTTTELTGLSITYRFNTNTILEGIQKMLEVSPETWYWYIDPGSNTLYFKEVEATPDFVLTKGRHLHKLKLKLTIDELVNKVYFSGGTVGDQNLYAVYTDEDSVAEYGQRIERLSDNRVTLQSTADAKGQTRLDTKKNEQYVMTIEILDETMDITLFRPGLTVSVVGFRSFIDALVLRIVRVEYAFSKAILYLGMLPYRSDSRLEQINRGLIAEQTVANPDEPT